MLVSVIIPVWNGAGTIGQCLDALAAGSSLPDEIICVNNGSVDSSAAEVAARPGVRLLPQLANLGFAGGVNVGLAAARGDLLVLLNQDCIVRPGWLAALRAVNESGAAGILGCVIFHADGRLDHVGARLSRPLAFGEHLDVDAAGTERALEFVTGAALAIRRAVYVDLGPLDDGFYPAYYEDADYCFRARRRGYAVTCVPGAEVDHLRTARTAYADPLRFWMNQHRARYRFVLKHCDESEWASFLSAESAAARSEPGSLQSCARALALGMTLRDLHAILGRRSAESGGPPLITFGCQARLGLARFARDYVATLAKMNEETPPGPILAGIPQGSGFAGQQPDTRTSAGGDAAGPAPEVYRSLRADPRLARLAFLKCWLGASVPSPSVSVIVNTINRAGPLRTLLFALEQQSYPLFEVIVVVGPVTDHTLEVLSPYERAGRVTVLRCPTANLSRSRNVGLRAARGDLVAYIDDDAVPCRRWLEQTARLLSNPNVDGTGGVVYRAHPGHAYTQLRLGIVSSLSEMVDVRSSTIDQATGAGRGLWWAPRPMGTNMAFRRQSIVSAGGFDEFYNYVAEETDLAFRMFWSGHNLRPVREAPVYHFPASSHTRQVFTHRGSWWRLATRSFAYYCARNASLAGEPRRAILRRWAELVSGHWWAYAELARRGDLRLQEVVSMGIGDLAGLASGVAGGLRGKRQLLADVAISPGSDIAPFQRDSSALQPAVDPFTGARASITISEPPLRVCLLSHSYPPVGYDGIGRLSQLMAKGLFELGHSVHVVASGDREQVSFSDGAFVHRIPYTLDRYERYHRFPNLRNALNSSHAVADKVHRLVMNDGVQIVDSPLWLLEGLVTLVRGEVPVVARLVTTGRQVAALHEDSGEDFRLIGEMERALIERAAHVLPNTRATLKAAEESYGISVDAARCTIVPYGIVPAADEDVRPFDISKPPANPTVLFVGRLEKRKGILDLFEAIPLILRRVPKARFVIVGADNSRHDGFENREGTDYPTFFARRYARCQPAVTFTGTVADDRLQQLYQTCDLFVAPSLYESFGLIYTEAMNYGKPVIGCRAGGVPEVIDEGVSGLLVDPESPAYLADAVISLLQSPARLRELGLAGRQQVLARFHYVEMARRFAEVYRKTIRTCQPPTSTGSAG
jgi:glycogen(starch) synthase